MHFCLILAVLGRLLASFRLSWEASGPHFGSLGASWGALLAQVGPSWPKIAKKIDFLNLNPEVGLKLEAKKREKSMPKSMFFSDAFLTSIFIDFSSILDLKFEGLFDRFWT